MAVSRTGAAGLTVAMDLDSARSVVKIFEGLSVAVQRRIASIVAMSGASPILKAARANAPRETGLLAKSIRAMHRKGSSTNFREVIIKPVSMKRAFRRVLTGKNAGKLRGVGGTQKTAKQRASVSKWAKKGRIEYRNPVRYAHIVERGRTAVKAAQGKAIVTPQGLRRSSRAVGAQPFMRPAFDAKKGEAVRRMRARFDLEVQKAAIKLARRHKTPRRGIAA